MRDQTADVQIKLLLNELRLAQHRASGLGLVLAASLLGMAALGIQNDIGVNDDVAHLNDNADQPKAE